MSTERVTFDSHGRRLVGVLHLPDAAPPLGAVTVSGAWRTVKEQMPTTYAAALAVRGLAALTFDFAGWGESEGRPRRMESPETKAGDLAEAARYLRGRGDDFAGRVAGVAVCASAGYLAAAASRGDELDAVALVAPVLPGVSTVVAHLGGERGVAALRQASAAAREVYEQTGEEVLEQAVPRTEATTAPGADYYTNPRRGAVPTWDNVYNPASWADWLDFDAQASAPQLERPLLVVSSDSAEGPADVREYVAAVRGPVEQLWLPGITQFDFYDQPRAVSAAADAIASFLRRTWQGAPRR